MRLYGTGNGATNSLESYVDLTVEQGAGGSFGGGCGGFVADPGPSNTFSGTLADFATAHSDHAGGLGTFDPVSATGEHAEHGAGRHRLDRAHLGSRRPPRHRRQARAGQETELAAKAASMTPRHHSPPRWS